MVKERNSNRASSGQYHLSPRKTDRKPLANISAKMQADHTNPEKKERKDALGRVMPDPQPSFGQAGPLRPAPAGSTLPSLQMENQTQPALPQPQKRPTFQVPQPPEQAPPSSHAFVSAPPARPRFILPGQQAPPPPPAPPAQQYGTATEAARAVASQPYHRSFQTDGFTPVNVPRPTVPAPPKPTFISIGPNTYFQPFVPPQQVHGGAQARDEDDGFDPDAAIRAGGNHFGAADPLMYVDAAKTNENIQNLLEGAFDDDEDKSRTRLRRRARKALEDEKQKEAKGLAAKLAAMEVRETEVKTEAPEKDEEDDEDDGTVEGLAIKLLPHQVNGVAWMIDKEVGHRKRNGVLPHGGILADDMGLGKTIQAISLILTNPRPGPDAKPEHPKQKMPGKEVGKGTLVVAPLALIKQWEGEIKHRVCRSHALRVLVHHGPSRTKSSVELKKHDVVITTYQTLTSEYQSSNVEDPNGPRVGCFGVHWYRIILDEAHSIKNRNAKSTIAACALGSWYRWCLTGTPMQNNLDELQSLIKFLRIKPYCELSNWKAGITVPMKDGRGNIAMRRIQYFLKAFMKRRTKDVLKQDGALNFGGKSAKEGEAPKQGGMQIVKREVVTEDCYFHKGERTFYERLERRADERIKKLELDGINDYIGALVILLRLRQACNHPRLVEMAMSKDKDALATGASGTGSQKTSQVEEGEMDALTALMGGVSVQSKVCDVCQVKLSAVEAAEGSTRCYDCERDLAMVRNDDRKSRKHGKGEWAGNGQEEHVDLDKAEGSGDEEAEGGGEDTQSDNSDRGRDENEDDNSRPSHSASGLQSAPSKAPRSSTKIRRLLRILQAETPSHKVIVFSQFTTMLDLLEPHLRAQQHHFVRYDGSMRPDAREASLHALRTDAHCRVLLCSLKCGSLGLNLTAASRVVIFEPFWNPFVEEQAIDRVHRLNQTVDVKVYRLLVEGTVEERIVELQERKRELAEAAIEGGKAVAKLSMKDLLALFRHDAVDGPQKEGELDTAAQAQGVTKARTPVKPVKRVRNEHEIYGRRW